MSNEAIVDKMYMCESFLSDRKGRYMENKKKIQMILGVAAFILLGVLYLCFNDRQGTKEVVTESLSDADAVQQTADGDDSSGDDTTQSLSGTFYIHICGAVKKPGVYTFDTQPRVIDVVEKAGGFTKKADTESINLAETVADGTQLVIAKKTKKSSQAGSVDTACDSDSGKVNINIATEEELMTLNGIGESKAAQIISYRDTNGDFQTIEDIMNISGIKEGIFSKIKDSITV